MTLTPKQQLFCDEYLIDLNATQAAIRAGYSAKTASSIGEQLLRKLEIQSVLQERMKERQECTRIDADYVLKRLSQIDEMDVADILNDDSSLRPVTSLHKHHPSGSILRCKPVDHFLLLLTAGYGFSE